VRFLIDECLSPALVGVANEAGYEAYHVAHRGWAGHTDAQLVEHLLANELTLVTNNRADFLALLGHTSSHPGLIVILANVRREEQMTCFGVALDAVGDESLMNRVVEVDGRYKVKMYDLPVE
jgi:predicted nuclease of predicted toxin-antitoxin system